MIIDINNEKVTLNNYVEAYYEMLKEYAPKSIKYIDFINQVIIYVIQIYSSFNFKNEDYKLKLSDLEIYDICFKILESLDIKYKLEFQELLDRNIIKYDNYEFSSTTKSKVKIVRRNNIQDILNTIHEFFHYIHLEKYNFDDHNVEWQTSTEIIAMTFEFYAFFYMYYNNICKDDILNDFIVYIMAIYNHSSKIVDEALILNIYDKYHNISKQTRNEFALQHNIVKAHMDTLKWLNPNKGFSFIEEYSYILGFPISIYLGNIMSKDNDFKVDLLKYFNDINKYTFEEFLTKLDVIDILNLNTKGDYLYNVMGDIYHFTEETLTNKQIPDKIMNLKNKGV